MAASRSSRKCSSQHAAVRDRVHRLVASRAARRAPHRAAVRDEQDPLAGVRRARSARPPRARARRAARASRRPGARRRGKRASISARVRPDHAPTSISRSPASATTGTAVRRGDDLAPSRARAAGRSSRPRRTASSRSCSASSRACARPVSFSGGSAQPCQRPSRFQSVSPCRARRIVVTAATVAPPMDLGLARRCASSPARPAGIGLEVARLLPAEGARVVTSGRRDDGHRRAPRRRRPHASPASRSGSSRAAVERFGRVDCLVNNVGGTEIRKLRGAHRRRLGARRSSST